MTEELVNINTQAVAKLAEVEQLAAQLGQAEEQLERGYGQLAVGLKEIADNKYWDGAYESFGAFLKHLKAKYQVGRAQLYNYLSTARELDGDVSADQLSQMGISKALVLRDAKAGGESLTDTAINAALDPNVTVKELKQLLFEQGMILEPEEGSWFDMGFEFMVSDEERLVLQSAASAAMHEDPPIPTNIKPFAQRKMIATKWAMSYLSGASEHAIEGENVL